MVGTKQHKMCIKLKTFTTLYNNQRRIFFKNNNQDIILIFINKLNFFYMFNKDFFTNIWSNLRLIGKLLFFTQTF